MPSVDAILGPPPKPKVDDLLGPPSAAPKPKGVLTKIGDYVTSEVKSGIVEPAKRLASVEKGIARDKGSDPLKGVQKGVELSKAALEGAAAPVNAPVHAALQRPYGAAMSKVTGGKYSAPQAEHDMGVALMGLKGPAGAEALEARGASAVAKRAAKFDVPKVDDILGEVPKSAPKTAAPPKVDDVLGPALERGKARTMAAKAEASPEPELRAPGPIVGEEAKPATRTANALYRLGGNLTADKIEMRQFREALPPEIRGRGEDLYHALEEPLANPGAKVPDDLQPAYKALQPLLKEQTELVNELRARNSPDIDPYLEDQGYVHRIRADRPNLVDPAGGAPRSPFQTRKSLVKRADAQKQRTSGFITTDAKGKETFWRGAPPETDLMGQPWKAQRQATTKEVEANTDIRFQKDAFDNTMANVMQLRRVKRNLEVLDTTLDDMKGRGVAHRAEWTFKDPDGGLRVARSQEETPKGFVSFPDVPQLKGWVFDKNDAQVQELKDWLPRLHEEDWVQKLDRINNFMLRSNFLSPFVHPKNIAEFWATSRGFDWLMPQGMAGLAKTMPKAVTEVLTMGPTFKQYLREGSALLSGDARTNQFHEMLVNKGAQELVEDPQSFREIAKSFGEKLVGTPAQLYQRIQDASHKAMWMTSDIMMMQRVMELQEKGYTAREAIRKAEEMIPNYRVPAQVFDGQGGRMLHHVFANNRLFSIGRYHYNKLNAWGTMFRKIAKGSTEERQEALGQFLVAGILGAVVIPAIDKGIKIATGNPNARVRRGGLLAVPDAMGRMASGDESVAQGIASILDISPMASLASEEIRQKDYFGEDVTSPYRSPLGNAVSEAELPAREFGPVNMGLEALSGSYGPGRVGGNLLGVDMPKKPHGKPPARVRKMLRSKGRKQDRRDPLVEAVRSFENQ